MKKVKAWQMIYGNVEEEESPTRSRGFQTLRLSQDSGIDPSELASLEARLVYSSSSLEPTKSDPVKHVFHITSTGKVLFVRAQGVPGKDREGRTGRYLAHGLVFDRDEVKKLPDPGSDIFTILRTSPFVTKMAQAFDPDDPARYDIDYMRVELHPADLDARVELVRQWQGEFKKLAILALSAERLAAERQMVLFEGSPPEVRSAIEAAFTVLPNPQFALRCTFDTHFEGCNPVGTYYWGVGLAKASGNVRFIRVDARSCRVVSPLPFEAETCYEHWICRSVDAGRIRELLKDRKMAYALCEWLDGREVDPAELDRAEAHPKLIESVFQANPGKLEERLLARLREQVPASVAQRLLPSIAAECLSGDAAGKLRNLRGQFPRAELYGKLHEAYRSNDFQEPPANELRELHRCREELPADLRLIVACWEREGKRIQKELENLKPDEYRRFLEMAFVKGIGDPVELLIKGNEQEYMNLFLSDKRFRRISRPGLIDRLLKLERADLVPSVVPNLEELSAEERSEIKRVILRRARAAKNNTAVLDLLYRILRGERFRRPSWRELLAYRTLVSLGHHELLDSLVACWGGRDPDIGIELDGLSSNAYGVFVRDALTYKICHPLFLVTGERAAKYVEIYLDEPALQEASVPDLIGRLLSVRGERSLPQAQSLLAAFDDRLQWPEWRLIRRRIIGARVDFPPEFLHFVDQRISATEPWGLRAVKSLFGLMFKVAIKLVEAFAELISTLLSLMYILALIVGAVLLAGWLIYKFAPGLIQLIFDLRF